VPELAGDLETEPAELQHHVGPDSRAQFGMEAEVGGEVAIFHQVVGDPCLELL
jgi:hypothetical protein